MIVLYERSLVPVVMCGSETMLRKENESSRINALQMDNLRGVLGIRRMDRVLNARIKEFCGVKEGLDEKIDEGVPPWFGHVEKKERDNIAKRIYV